MNRKLTYGLALLLMAGTVYLVVPARKNLGTKTCPLFYQQHLRKVSGKVEADRSLRITYFFRLNYGGNDDLDFIATDLGKNPRLRYIKYSNDGRFREDTQFPIIYTEHARDLVAFKYNGKKAFAFTDHGYDQPPFNGGQPRIVVLEKSGWTDQTDKIFPAMRSFNFTLTALEKNKKTAPDLFLATVVQVKSGNSVLLKSDVRGKYSVSKILPQEFDSPDFCYMLARKIMSLKGVDYVYLGACDRPENAVKFGQDRILRIDGEKVTLLPQDQLPPRKIDSSWGTVSAEIADLNNDGNPDIVAVVHNQGYTQGGIQVHLNTGEDMKFYSPKKSFYEIGASDKTSFIPFVKVGDLDGDHLPEFLVAHAPIGDQGKKPDSIQKFGLFRNIDGENFEDVSHCLPSNLRDVLNVEIADFDKNGKLDLLLVSYHGEFEIYFNE